MKTTLNKTALIFALLISTISVASATDYWHTNDHYTVQFDGEGEAFVTAKLELENIGSEPLRNLELEMPYRHVKVYRALQKDGYQDSWDLSYTTQDLSESNILKINLDRPVAPGESTTVYLAYRTGKIAEKDLSGWYFEFKGLRDNNALIKSAGANIEVPDGMNLKNGADSSVDYHSGVSGFSSSLSAQEMSSTIDRHSRQTDFETKSIDPGETFEVEGEYGESLLMLYLPDLFMLIPVLIVLGYVHRKVGLFSLDFLKFTGKEGFSFSRSFITALVSVISFFISIGVAVGSTQLLDMVPYGFELYILIALGIIDILLIFTSLFGPSVYLFSRYSSREGFVSFVLTIFFALILIILAAIMVPGHGLAELSTVSAY